MSSERSVAIVGGGVAGLAAGVLLSRRGVRVHLFEARDKVGGCCSSTRLGGYTFHDGAIFLALPGLLDAGFARLGLDRRRAVPLRPVAAGYTARLDDGSVVSMSARSLRVARPGASELNLDGEVARFAERWRPLVGCSRTTSSRARSRRGASCGGAGASSRSSTGRSPPSFGAASPTRRRAPRWPASCCTPGRPWTALPAMVGVGLASVLDEGFFLPEGGMGRIPEALAEGLRASGGEIHTGAGVARIVTRDGRAIGVEVAGSGIVECDAILSAVSGMATAALLRDDALPRRLRRKAASAPLSHTAVCVQLGLSNLIDNQRRLLHSHERECQAAVGS